MGLMIIITMSCYSQYVRIFDGVSLKCMLTQHTDYLENTNLALHFDNVADPWYRLYCRPTLYTITAGGMLLSSESWVFILHQSK